MRILWKVGHSLFSILFIISGLVLIGLATYFFAFNLLRNPLIGNDAINALANAVWIDRYFPNVPYWYPLVGGGVSLILGYTNLFSFAVVILSRISSLNIVSSMAFLNFLSVLIPAISIFLYVFLRFKSKLAAIISGAFFLLSPLSYVLISGAGFLANSFATIFALPLFTSLDLFFESRIEGKKNFLIIFYLLVAGITFSLGTLAHPTIPVGIFIVFCLYSFIYCLLRFRLKGISKWFWSFLITAVTLASISFFATKPLNDYTSFSNRDIGPIPPGDTSTFPPVELRGILGLVGWKPDYKYPFPNLAIVPLVWISALIGFIAALIKKDKKLTALSLVGTFSVYQTGTFTLWNLIQPLSPFIAQFVFNRYFYIPTMILLPILGGIGIVNFIRLPFDLVLRFVKEGKKLKEYLLKPTFGVIRTIFIFSAIPLAALYLNPLSGMHERDRPWLLHYGEEDGISLKNVWNRTDPFEPCSYPKKETDINPYCDNPIFKEKNINLDILLLACEQYQAEPKPLICLGEKPVSRVTEWDEWNSEIGWYKMRNEENVLVPVEESDIDAFIEKCQAGGDRDSETLCYAIDKTDLKSQLAFSAWPKPILPQNFDLSKLNTASLSKFENPYFWISQEGVRIDVTPSLGAWTKEWSIVNKSEIINAYTGQLVLNKSFNSFFRDTMYSKDLVKQATAVGNLAKYFGTSGIINTGGDQTEKFISRSWKSEQLPEGGSLWTPPFQTSIYSLETKPTVLVIGSTKNQAYGQVFRAAAMGGLSYDEGILFEGGEKIDDYSLKELSKFSLLILHGYSYKNRERAYSLLEKYLQEGGSVFIDTGWQYVAADWGEADRKEKILGNPFPVEKTYWGSVGPTLRNASLEASYTDQIDLAAFSPLVWEGGDWNLAYANASDLVEGARAVLKVGDRVIMAERQVGKGKIVWSGVNFISHARDSGNEDELKLLNNILKNLVGEARDVGQIGVAYRREPDMLEVNLTKTAPEGSFFYFKESYYPYWKASIENSGVKKDIPIYIAGPRFMAADVSGMPAGSTLIFEFKPGLSLLIPKIVSIVTFLLLLTLLLDSMFGQRLIKRLSFAFSSKSKTAKVPFGKNFSNFKKSVFGDEDENY